MTGVEEMAEMKKNTREYDTSGVSMAVARHVVRQGLEKLHLYGNDPMSDVVTLSTLINMSDVKSSLWYVGTLVLVAGCSRSDRKILVDTLVSDLLSSSIFIRRLFSLEWAMSVAQHVDELGESWGNTSIVRAALQNEGISLTFVIHRWLSQCFWNYLPFDVILVYLVMRFENWEMKENSEVQDFKDTSYFVIAILEHIVENYLRDSARRRPTKSLRDVLIDGPLPSGLNLWGDQQVWDRIERWRNVGIQQKC
jgi:hypothetical protein